MSRPSLPLGTEKPTPQGYVRVRVSYNLSETGWAFKHHLIAWQKYGRNHDPAQERVIFIDGDKTNYNPDNIAIQRKGGKQLTREERMEQLRTEIQKLTQELEALEREE